MHRGRRVIAKIAALSLALMLSGCASLDPVTNGESIDNQVIAVTPIGAATFGPNIAGISGTARLLAEGRYLRVDFSEVHFPVESSMFTASLTPIPAGQSCLVDGQSVDFSIEALTDPVLDIDDGWGHDPRFLRTLVLGVKMGVTQGGVDSSGLLSTDELAKECVWGSVAEAPIEWFRTDRGGSVRAADSGVGVGATGEVVLDEVGAPAAYVIAGGDSARQIAARFGLSEEQLRFLNPYFDFTGFIEPGDILVLDTAWRGLNANQVNGFGTPGLIAPAE